MPGSLDEARHYIARNLAQIKAAGQDTGKRDPRAIAMDAWRFWEELSLEELQIVVIEEAKRIGFRGIS